MPDLIELVFVEICDSNDDNMCTCILEENGLLKRKIFLTITHEERDIIMNIVKETNIPNKENIISHSLCPTVSDFLKSGYKIESAKIEVDNNGEIGSIVIKKNNEKFNLLLDIFTIILLMVGKNINTFIDVDSLNFCTVSENNFSFMNTKNDSYDELLMQIDFFIEEENCEELKKICEKLKLKTIDTSFLA